MANYSLARPDIIEKLKDRDWFLNCVRENYLTASKKHSFIADVHQFRAYEAHDLWIEDLERLLEHGIEDSSDLDIYKHAGFLTYWLRRRLVINTVEIDNSDSPNPKISIKEHIDNLPSNMKEYLQYHNEMSAFEFGMQICFNYRINNLQENGASKEEIEEFINRVSKNSAVIISDIVVFMKQKSVSPHTLYLVFKTLFL